MSFRFDKFVWSVRIAKTRSQAAELISKGKVKLNQAQVKPAREPKVGDVVCVYKNTAVFTYKIIGLLDKRVGPKLVENYIIDTTPQTEIDKFKMYQLAQSSYRQYGTGRPNKHDLNKIEDFLEWDDEEDDEF
jgi:ribosome-associated heat shock protein Hsp15